MRYIKLQKKVMENICTIGRAKRWAVTYCRALSVVTAGHQRHVHPETKNVSSEVFLDVCRMDMWTPVIQLAV
jgi:hypothetical protein